MKRVYITTIVTALLMLAIFGTAFSAWESKPETDVLKVGFIYENDESTPYTANFALARDALMKEYHCPVVFSGHLHIQAIFSQRFRSFRLSI